MLAGWLFADLFLLLLVAGLAALPARGTPDPEASGSASGFPSPPPTPTRPPGLDPDYLTFTLSVSPDAYRAGAEARLVRQATAKLNAKNPERRKVGFVLVFAADDRNNAGRAQDTANDVVDSLRRSPAFAGSAGLGYWNGKNGDFELKVFLLN